MAKTKLELTWIGKDTRPKLEPRILLEDADKSYHAPQRVTENDLFDNRLIFGDNLLALKALEAEFTGKIKCIYIDPPYNTGSAFEQYDDGIEHSLWLSLMRDRLEILRRLLTDDGSIWVTLDDNEAHYCKVLMDEVFGRTNFAASFVWQKTLTRRNDARVVSVAHDYVLVFCKDIDSFRINKLGTDAKRRATYTNRDNDPRGDWLAVPFHAPNIRPNLTYPIVTPGGRTLMPPTGRCWSTTKEKYLELLADNRIYFGRDGNGMAQRKKFWSESDEEQVPWTWWPYEETGENREANREAKAIAEQVGVEAFATPKPERMLKRVLELGTKPGDWVLDSFAGSGTTGAVAHKMGRRWIMVELGKHCHTHVAPRLQLVIDGKDEGGITEEVQWKGGGGFRYFRLAPSLLEKDSFGNWIISKEFNPAMLAEAICKLEGFRYAPSETLYWQHGQASETDFIYVTTQTLSREQLARLNEEVGDKRSLLVMCAAFRTRDLTAFPNLTIKKIPKTVLTRCEWGKDDYSLEIKNLPAANPEPSGDAPPAANNRAARKAKAKQESRTLFDLT